MYITPKSPRHGITLTFIDRTKRVKDARNEAQKEIEEYRKEKENEYQKFEKEVRIVFLECVDRKTNGYTAQLRQPEG